MDGMTGRMLKAIWIPVQVLALMASCLKSGHFPEEWKAARVVVLLKAPEKLRTCPSSYRGICLLSIVGKVLERIMVTRMLDTLEGGFSDWHFGFQKKH